MLSLDCREGFSLFDHSHIALRSVLEEFDALILHLEEMTVLHGQVGSDDEVVIRIERIKALAC